MTALAIGTFPDEGSFLRARVATLAAERRIVGEWLPYPSEALAGEDGTRGIRPIGVIAGLAGAAALFALETWSAVSAYRFDEGGRPLFSWPAFVPAPVEVGALVAAIGGTVMFFRNAGLTRLNHPAFDLEEVARASCDAFVLAVACDAGEPANAVLGAFAAAGAAHSRLVTR